MESKICTKCNISKLLDSFYIRKDSKDGYRNSCKECDLKRGKTYYKNNIISKNEYHYKYRKLNSENLKTKSKIYRINNKEKINLYLKNRKSIDPLFKLSTNIRSMICDCFRRNGYTKNSKTYEILGCTFEEFKRHLESKFELWMNWDNHGLYNGELNYGWDVDHKIPISTATTEEDVIRLNHYSNLQPLCSHINRVIKKDKLYPFIIL